MLVYYDIPLPHSMSPTMNSNLDNILPIGEKDIMQKHSYFSMLMVIVAHCSSFLSFFLIPTLSYLLSFKKNLVVGNKFLSIFFFLLYWQHISCVLYCVALSKVYSPQHLLCLFFYLHFFVAFSFIFVFVVIRQAFAFA